jgi:two-component system sensor histidine kinase/response regulator
MTSAPARPDEKVKVLIAEDSPTQAQRLTYILENEGYLVEAAENGRLALERARKSPPALIISDVMMPEMDGYDLSRAVKADPALKGIPLIIVTTLSDPEDVIRGVECGADSFILKPYDEQYLMNRVRYALFNRDIRGPQDPGTGVEIVFNGNRHFITAERLQLLNLLLSTYEGAIQRTRDLEKSQAELQRVNVKLENANRELQWFTSAVSHDLRAPLRHINGYIAMLAEDKESTLSDEGKRYMEVISRSARDMGRLIDELLEFSRVDQADMRHTPVDLGALVQEIIWESDLATDGRKIEWKVSPLPHVAGDPAMLRQVLSNLIGNAVKYTGNRDPAQIEIGSTADEHEIVAYVRDNGAGFNMKYVDKLFGLFQRLHSVDEFEGTGLGLAIVRRIVARHGGRTWAEAKVGEGATFYFTLPAQRH